MVELSIVAMFRHLEVTELVKEANSLQHNLISENEISYEKYLEALETNQKSFVTH